NSTALILSGSGFAGWSVDETSAVVSIWHSPDLVLVPKGEAAASQPGKHSCCFRPKPSLWCRDGAISPARSIGATRPSETGMRESRRRKDSAQFLAVAASAEDRHLRWTKGILRGLVGTWSPLGGHGKNAQAIGDSKPMPEAGGPKSPPDRPPGEVERTKLWISSSARVQREYRFRRAISPSTAAGWLRQKICALFAAG